MKIRQADLLQAGKYATSIRILGVILLVLLISACSRTRRVVIPPVTGTATNTYHHGKFVWFDLLTHDVEAVKNFYGTLLGWEFDGGMRNDPLYTTITLDGTPIGGIVYKEQKSAASETHWISYLSVPDVDQAVEMVRAKGGTVYEEPIDYPKRGRLAIVADPQGALLAFVKAEGGDPNDRNEPVKHFWLWNELLTQDAEASVSFYEDLIGYQHESLPSSRDGIDYYVLKIEDKSRGGIVKAPWETMPSNWLPYVLVDDPAPLVAQVTGLGGRVLLAPDKNVRNGSVAVIVDPTGGAIAIQKWPFEEDNEMEGAE